MELTCVNDLVDTSYGIDCCRCVWETSTGIGSIKGSASDGWRVFFYTTNDLFHTTLRSLFMWRGWILSLAKSNHNRVASAYIPLYRFRVRPFSTFCAMDSVPHYLTQVEKRLLSLLLSSCCSGIAFSVLRNPFFLWVLGILLVFPSFPHLYAYLTFSVTLAFNGL